MVIKVVQVCLATIFDLSKIFVFKEYERTVIFRLGRLLSGGARGPGVFFIIPCVDIFEKVDLRVQNFDVPPQEVNAVTKQFLFKGTLYQKVSFDIC